MNRFQEIFDKVWAGLKAQEFRRSLGEDGSCAYRGIDGSCCAAGHLIPDEAYKPEFDAGGGCTVRQVQWFHDNYNCDETSFIRQLQSIHDNTSDMELRLREFAERQGLTIND